MGNAHMHHAICDPVSLSGVGFHGNGWVEYARPSLFLIMAYVNIGVADSINISIADRLLE